MKVETKTRTGRLGTSCCPDAAWQHALYALNLWRHGNMVQLQMCSKKYAVTWILVHVHYTCVFNTQVLLMPMYSLRASIQ
jgi:hypothetical protein